jgi:hypothetical protein
MITGIDPQSTQTYYNENPKRSSPFYSIPQSALVVIKAFDNDGTIDPRDLESEPSRPHLPNMEKDDQTSYCAQPIPQLPEKNKPIFTGQFYN